MVTDAVLWTPLITENMIAFPPAEVGVSVVLTLDTVEALLLKFPELKSELTGPDGLLRYTHPSLQKTLAAVISILAHRD